MTDKKTPKKEVIAKMLKEPVIIANPEYKGYLENEYMLLEKKSNSRGTSETAKENIELKEILLKELTKCEKPVTVTDLMNRSEVIKNYICKNGNPLSNQKITALFKIMLETDKTIDKIVDKKKSYFTVI